MKKLETKARASEPAADKPAPSIENGRRLIATSKSRQEREGNVLHKYRHSFGLEEIEEVKCPDWHCPAPDAPLTHPQFAAAVRAGFTEMTRSTNGNIYLRRPPSGSSVRIGPDVPIGLLMRSLENKDHEFGRTRRAEREAEELKDRPEPPSRGTHALGPPSEEYAAQLREWERKREEVRETAKAIVWEPVDGEEVAA